MAQIYVKPLLLGALTIPVQVALPAVWVMTMPEVPALMAAATSVFVAPAGQDHTRPLPEQAAFASPARARQASNVIRHLISSGH